jgi:hypothetical protein
MSALEHGLHQVEHLGFGVGVEGDEQPPSLLRPGLEYLCFDVPVVRNLNSVEIVKFLMGGGVGKLFGLVDDLFGSVLEVLNFKCLLFFDTHFC